MLKPGSRFGEYEILDVIGQGSSAITYSAHRPGDSKLVALKVPRPQCLMDTTFVVRFLQEGALGLKLRHKSIVRVLDAGEHMRTPYLAMEYVNGTTLADHLVAGRRFTLGEALELSREIAAALAYAHRHKVVHRNLKPGHVMLQPDGGVKIMDLGVARAVGDVGVTSANVFLGTPQYAAPEAIDARHADHRCDLYSLGTMLFEMLEGRPPFPARTVLELLEVQKDAGFPTRDSLSYPPPEPVWQLIVRLCADKPEDRPQSADEVVEEIERLLGEIES